LGGFEENIMIRETHMKIGDYFERLKYASVRGRNKCLDKDAGFSPVKKFEGILSSCRFAKQQTKNIESEGLKIADYLINPVQKRPSGASRNRLDSEKLGTKYINASLDRELCKYIDLSKKSPITEIKQKQNSAPIRTLQTDVLSEPDDICYSKQIDQSINEASSNYGLPACLIKGVIKAESAFQVNAVSSAGAQGLMQLMPETAEELGVKDPFDIDQNIDGGTRYLKKMLELFGGDVKLALAAYNAGPGTVNRYNGNVPYRETVLYVKRVLKYSRQMV
jgi:hypothetical protein